MKLNDAAQKTAMPGREHTGGDDGGDRVRGVVEAVDEVEHQRNRNHGIQQEWRSHASGVLDRNRLDDVRSSLDCIDGSLHGFDDIFPFRTSSASITGEQFSRGRADTQRRRRSPTGRSHRQSWSNP